jgi:hypothetical protein
MRVLLGGLVGAAASAAAWFFMEYATGQEFGWLAIAVGLITGLCVNAAAGAGAPASYGRAAFAVALTLLAMVGGRAVYAKVMQNVSQVTTIRPAENANLPQEVPAQDPQGEADEQTPVGEEQAVRPRQGIAAGDGMMRFQNPKVNSMSELDMLWMGLAALVAYFTGKGSGKAGPIAMEPTPEGTARA